MRRALLFLLLPAIAQAGTLEIHLKGMVCAFCAQGAVRALRSNDAVADARADLDRHEIVATLKPGRKLPAETVRGLIEDAGLKATEIHERP